MKTRLINKTILLPYYLVLKLRHYMYDRSILKSYTFPVPVISVGNITVGGTGKTPFVEYLIRTMDNSQKIAVLSRGYGRKSRGWHEVNPSDTAIVSGDEPLQIKKKFPNVLVCVDENRVRGIEKLLSLPAKERPDTIILDDAFQHRRVRPSQNIVLVDYNRPVATDCLLPIGRLRDLPQQIKRADMVVVTKCPPEISSADVFLWKESAVLPSDTKVIFSYLNYLEAVPLFAEGDKRYLYSKHVMLLTSIANPGHLRYHLMDNYKIVSSLHFPDHHNFRKGDIKKINRWGAVDRKALVITTEKDAQRLYAAKDLLNDIKSRIFYFPIEIEIVKE